MTGACKTCGANDATISFQPGAVELGPFCERCANIIQEVRDAAIATERRRVLAMLEDAGQAELATKVRRWP